MTNHKTTLFLILDAWRWDYINPKDTPHLHHLSQEGIHAEKLKTSAGFTQRSSIFTGTWPVTTRNLAMYTYNPKIAQYKYMRFFPFLRLIEFRWIFMDRAIRYALAILNIWTSKARRFPPFFIPYKILPKIGISEDDKPIYEPGAFGKIESIFDYIHDKAVPFEFIMHPLSLGNDNMVFEKILSSKLERGLILGQFSDSDGGIHKAGVKSSEARDIIREIDRKIGEIKKTFDEKYDEYELVIIGDHGMTDVEKSIDINGHIIPLLKQQGLKFGEDYFTFLSSTLAHFYWENDKAEAAIKELIQTDFFQKNGFVLDEERSAYFNIPYQDVQYGNLIWAANNKVLLFPDYFHRYKKYKAMHGYMSDDGDTRGTAIVYSNKKAFKKKKERCDLIDICPTICDSIGVPTPKQSIGESLFD